MSHDDWVALPCGAMGLSVVCDCGISWSYLLFLYREVLTTVPTTDVALYRAVMTTVPTTEAVLYRAVMDTVPTMEVALYRPVMATVSYRDVVLYKAVLTTVPQREVALYKAVMATVPTTEVVLFRAVMPSNYLLETSNNWFLLFSRWKTNLFFIKNLLQKWDQAVNLILAMLIVEMLRKSPKTLCTSIFNFMMTLMCFRTFKIRAWHFYNINNKKKYSCNLIYISYFLSDCYDSWRFLCDIK